MRVRSSGNSDQQQQQSAAGTSLPWNVESRLDQMNGVVASGAVAPVSNPGGVRTVPVIDPTSVATQTVPVIATSSGYLAAVRGHIAAGRMYDAGHIARRDRVVVIGADLADSLGITSVANQPGLYIGEELFVVIGIVDYSARDSGITGSILVPATVAEARFGVERPERVVIETELGAAGVIAAQAAM
ncbi:MAG TPA: ABC transporter permease, partial [Ilumatobacteraceae bacterium]|nr:ABC transporter permease [Ilumatobacteraceae bacterium]